jgi:hypothetical protein
MRSVSLTRGISCDAIFGPELARCRFAAVCDSLFRLFTLKELGFPSAQLRNEQATKMDERVAALFLSLTNLLHTLAAVKDSLVVH